jgi:hypothetical protein
VGHQDRCAAHRDEERSDANAEVDGEIVDGN